MIATTVADQAHQDPIAQRPAEDPRTTGLAEATQFPRRSLGTARTGTSVELTCLTHRRSAVVSAADATPVRKLIQNVGPHRHDIAISGWLV
jgi:hypothetical protein